VFSFGTGQDRPGFEEQKKKAKAQREVMLVRALDQQDRQERDEMEEELCWVECKTCHSMYESSDRTSNQCRDCAKKPGKRTERSKSPPPPFDADTLKHIKREKKDSQGAAASSTAAAPAAAAPSGFTEFYALFYLDE